MIRAALVLLLLATGGCYLQPLRSNGQLHSNEGVRIRLVGQDCEDHVGSDGDPVSRSLDVKLELSNPTKDVLQFQPDGVTLSVESGVAAMPRSGDVYQMAPCETRSFEMRFVHHSLCSQDFSLAFDHALTLGARPIEMATLHFTP